MAGPYPSELTDKFPKRNYEIWADRDVQRFGDQWSRMGWGRGRPDPYQQPSPPQIPAAAGPPRYFPDRPRGMVERSIEAPPRRLPKKQAADDKAYKKKLDRLLKEQKKAQKEVREAELELRTLTDDLQSDLSGEPRRYRGPQGSQIPVPPPPPPMPREQTYHEMLRSQNLIDEQNVLRNPNYNDPFSSQTTPNSPFAAQQRPPEASLVPPGFRQRQWLPEGAYAPPAPPASPQPVPQQQYQYPPWGMRRGNQVNPWAGARPATQQYPR